MSLSLENKKIVLGFDTQKFNFNEIFSSYLSSIVPGDLSDLHLNLDKTILPDSVVSEKNDQQLEFYKILYKIDPGYDLNNSIKEGTFLKTYKRFGLSWSPSPFNNNIFLEQKAKDNDRVFKKRINLNKETFDKIIDNKLDKINLESINESDFYKEFVFKILKKKEYPKIVIDYNRRPLVSDYDSYFRISIDYNLVARNKNLSRKIECLKDHKIMEVKFFRRIPLWFHRIIQKYNLRRVSISKFVVGMKFLRYAEDLT